jgi:penicillin-binding protein 2
MDPLHERRPPITPQLAVRVALFGAIALALFGIVFFRLWYLQVLSGDEYLAQARGNQVREERIQAPRGEIVDREGRVIVTNEKAIVVQVNAARLPAAERELASAWGQAAGKAEHAARRRGRDAEVRLPPIPPIPDGRLRSRFASLGRVLGMSATSIHRRVVRSLAVVPYAPVRLATDVSRTKLNFLEERRSAFPGIDVEEVYLREYPRGELAAQMLGTVGEVSPRQLRQRRFRGVKQGTLVGQEGLEWQYDRYLRGEDGVRRIQVDAFGNPKGNLRVTEPRAGQRLKLSVDLSLQRAGQAALTDSRANPGANPSAFVALNPRNGEVLAMGSNPSFDPEVLTRPLSQRRLEALFGDDVGAPRVNRAIAGAYPTGSVFKLVTALAALKAGIITPSTPIASPSCITIGSRPFCNARNASHGLVALPRALQVSSDVYFYRLGQALDSRPNQILQRWARRLGVGRETGIDLPEEREGLIPDRRWRAEVAEREERCRRREGIPISAPPAAGCGISDMRPWTVGDNVNLAVGQGDLQASPVQMAVAYAAIANGGRVVRPHLGLEVEDGRGRPLQRIERDPARRFDLDPGHRDAILRGLRLAAGTTGGTSYDVFKDWPRDLPVYGKTGTAERSGRPDDQSWYVAYVPAGRGRDPIVVAATVEDGGFGAEAAAPITRLILSEHFGVEKKVIKGESRTN